MLRIYQTSRVNICVYVINFQLNVPIYALKAASVVIKGSGDMIVIGGLIDDQRTTTSDRSGARNRHCFSSQIKECEKQRWHS